MLQLKRRPILWLATLVFVASLALSVAPTDANMSLLQRIQLQFGQKATSNDVADVATVDAIMSLPAYEQTNYGTEDCRIGVIGGLHTETIESNQWIETLDASWYINFAPYPATYQDTSGETVLVDAKHVPVIHIKQEKHPVTGARLDSYKMEIGAGRSLTKDTLAIFIGRNRGALWAIGNEPDREEAQDDTMPEVYARAYHDIRGFILEADPTAQFSNAGLVQVTPSRIQYLDTVMATYQELYGEQMPVDVWNIHVYPLEELTAEGEISGIASIALGSPSSLGLSAPPNREPQYCNSGDPESDFYENDLAFVNDDIICLSEHDDVRIFRHQVETMRQWMKDNGEQDKPLMISEMGVLWPYTEINDGDPETCGYLQDEFGRCLSPRRVSRFMSDVNDYLLTASDPNLGYSKGSEHMLVQQWAWFSVYQSDTSRQTAEAAQNDDIENGILGSSSNLINDPWEYLVPGQQSALTQIGQTFQSYAQTPENELAPNLYIDGTPDGYIVGRSNGQNEVEFSIPLRNDGNTSTDATTYVLIYSDPSLSDASILGRAEAIRGIGGCGTDVGYATIKFSVASDVDQFYVKIRDNQAENDAYTADNVYADAAGNPIPTEMRRQQGIVFLPFMNTKR